MVEHRGGPGLALEPPAHLGGDHHFRPWHLERHLAAKPGIIGEKDHAVGASAQLSADFEPAESFGEAAAGE